MDLTGHKYGEFVVVEMLYHYNGSKKTYCKCIDENEKESILRADFLRNFTDDKPKARNRKDIAGQKFGLLTAIRPTKKRTKNSCVLWECVCDCGNPQIIEVSATNLIRGHTLSCGCRHQSKWEIMIKDLLTELNVEFKEQYRFDDCWNKKHSDRLPFDFYLPFYNIIIEYDGEHHFQPVKGWGGEEKFKITQQNDCIKNNYCKNHNITLLRIPYTYSEEDVKKSIINILNPVTITFTQVIA